ncbi:hypothetical protein NX794_12510 [Streptomyces sp. LP11]|uniref:Nuclear transport factor 2 family protein n=1 Tax=Streptomyces pyxinicus TaxID=2970331 RepID=A0ABT2B0W6_9ACTN|nr:hypothetical protein [Streptomyces sp. LP11]MCS0602026.1 hypothetical protein [Streptomyces sp. LP11]
MPRTPRKRRALVALAACVLLPFTAAGCQSGEAQERGGTPSATPSPAGTILDGTDDTGRNLREVAAKGAPRVAVEVTPDTAGGWDVRLTFHRFRCSAPGTGQRVVPGRGLAHLFVDGHQVARLRTTAFHLPDRLVPRGTHHVTARLYADDGTVWAVRGRPVQSTADITVSGADAGPAEGTGQAGSTREPTETTTTVVVRD